MKTQTLIISQILENLNPLLTTIVADLQKEPEQMKNPWYYWIKWILTLPIRVISYPIRFLFMICICPATISSDNTDKYIKILKEHKESCTSDDEKRNYDRRWGPLYNVLQKTTLINYSISGNNNCRFAFISNETNTEETKERKLTINFCGNAEDIFSGLSALADMRNPPQQDLIFVGYPKWAYLFTRTS